MAELKTKKTSAAVDAFIASVENPQRQEELRQIRAMMKEVSGEEGSMWGTSIVGFGKYHYVYASGREGDWFKIGFSPRKRYLSLYIVPLWDNFPDLLDQLGKHKRGKGCLTITRLADINTVILQDLLSLAFAQTADLSA